MLYQLSTFHQASKNQFDTMCNNAINHIRHTKMDKLGYIINFITGIQADTQCNQLYQYMIYSHFYKVNNYHLPTNSNYQSILCRYWGQIVCTVDSYLHITSIGQFRLDRNHLHIFDMYCCCLSIIDKIRHCIKNNIIFIRYLQRFLKGRSVNIHL